MVWKMYLLSNVASFCQSNLDGGFKYFLFSPLFGEVSHFDEYFSKGLVQPPTSNLFFGGLKKQ